MFLPKENVLIVIPTETQLLMLKEFSCPTCPITMTLEKYNCSICSQQFPRCPETKVLHLKVHMKKKGKILEIDSNAPRMLQ